MKNSATCSKSKVSGGGSTSGLQKKKKKEKARNVNDNSSEDSEGVGRVQETSKVRGVGEKKAEEAKVKVTTHSSETKDSMETEMTLLIDSGVNKTLIS